MALRRAVAALCLSACVAETAAATAQSVQQRARAGTGEKVTPIQKLLQMLDGLAVKGKEEKHNEEVEFAKFHEWCDNVRATKTKSISQGAAQIEQLDADIMKAKSDAEVLSGEVADLEASISKDAEEAKAATAQRNKEHSNYAAEHLDISESIDACQRAKQALAARSADVAQSLVQVKSLPKIPAHAAALLQAFLSAHDGQPAEASPEANAYEFQSGGVVSLLEKLESKFKDQLLVLEKEEMNAKANYEVLSQQLEDNIKEEKSSASAKTAAKAKRLDDAATAKGDLAATETTKAEDEKTLSDTLAQCQARSEEFEKNQVTRAEEVKAIDKAVEILSSNAVSGNAEKHLPALIQKGSKAHSFAQLQAVAGPHTDARRRVAELLQARAKQLGSRYLALAAARVTADPFAKVKRMIQDLLVKLMEEANAEADQHAYCTTELAKNKQTRSDKTEEVDRLSAEFDELTAKSTRLTSEITELTDSIAELRGQQQEASGLRATEKKENTQAVADAKEAQTAVQQATEVLRAYYAKAADAALLQGAQGSQSGETLSQEMDVAAKAPYKGMQDSSTGIFGMLEVVLSDFARLESETLANEEAQASAHDKFMAETNESIAVKETEVEHKDNNKRLTDERARATKKELDLTMEELDKASDYYDKLKTQCVDAGMSYEDRVNAREQEIQSLREALEILGQSDLD
mmetsp:Transcript_40990/g.92372  ORF Transcript_40990/g.92372 Transcript_40990/m.92372 type:complete len:693 (+) Transcript_40990:72-2150(+)|eukprot:CAMPEP_0197889480 /NCGR_PEP_ID=MMETSP1439-20131203/24357_1 /TAXON_ID=66791 /ORGANISM="Gonyaulax spinifera, Strain CCMP409" /LENGTH=692 /DNA_ID=CAMNT_0043509459 /DNA_START=71 /DNA_END=2149 /DNA_ORIENTATION=+